MSLRNMPQYVHRYAESTVQRYVGGQTLISELILNYMVTIAKGSALLGEASNNGKYRNR